MLADGSNVLAPADPSLSDGWKFYDALDRQQYFRRSLGLLHLHAEYGVTSAVNTFNYLVFLYIDHPAILNQYLNQLLDHRRKIRIQPGRQSNPPILRQETMLESMFKYAYLHSSFTLQIWAKIPEKLPFRYSFLNDNVWIEPVLDCFTSCIILQIGKLGSMYSSVLQRHPRPDREGAAINALG